MDLSSEYQGFEYVMSMHYSIIQFYFEYKTMIFILRIQINLR